MPPKEPVGPPGWSSPHTGQNCALVRERARTKRGPADLCVASGLATLLAGRSTQHLALVGTGSLRSAETHTHTHTHTAPTCARTVSSLPLVAETVAAELWRPMGAGAGAPDERAASGAFQPGGGAGTLSGPDTVGCASLFRIPPLPAACGRCKKTLVAPPHRTLCYPARHARGSNTGLQLAAGGAKLGALSGLAARNTRHDTGLEGGRQTTTAHDKGCSHLDAQQSNSSLLERWCCFVWPSSRACCLPCVWVPRSVGDRPEGFCRGGLLWPLSPYSRVHPIHLHAEEPKDKAAESAQFEL